MNRFAVWAGALVALSSSVALARPCPPCADMLCVGDAEARRAHAEKRASLLQSGAPPRLVDDLLAKTAQCEYCLRFLPDALHIMLEYPSGTQITFQYTKYDEKLARHELRTHKITAFHIFIASDTCVCCDQKPPAQDPSTGLVIGETLSFGPRTLGADPPDLDDPGQPPGYLEPPEPPPPTIAHAACPACAALAEQRNKLATDAWSAEHTVRRHRAEQEWDYRRANYALDRGDMPAFHDAEAAAHDWQAKIDAAKAELDRAKAALKDADAALLDCNTHCGQNWSRPPPPKPAAAPVHHAPFKPSGSVDLRVGPSVALHGNVDHQLTIGAMARLKVLPGNYLGYVTFAPFVGVLNYATTIGLPVGFEYDVPLPVEGLYVYGRLGIGYVAQYIAYENMSGRIDSALILPEAGARYELARFPIEVGLDAIGLPIYANGSDAAVSYRITAYAGWLFGR